MSHYTCHLPNALYKASKKCKTLENVEALANSPEGQFQPVNDLSELAVTEMVNEVKHALEDVPANELKLMNPLEVLQAIKGLKAAGPNGIPNRVLRHLPKHVITLHRSV
jgi:hypothetical protein